MTTALLDRLETPPNSWSLVEMLLEEQQSLTAVEQFALANDHATADLRPPSYRQLIPLRQPRPGEQYAFEVDLDACSGCKACVTACHNLNGLEEDETWRSVGLLLGGTSQAPVLQHVTTACHHCIEPACLHGCPVNAYHKDPLTGIVRHLDDQCIGCQYCIWKCPYDVPTYRPSKGIVRKCDMCRDRLAADEAPACVQACPNQAIRIQIVDKQQVLEASEANQFLPGAPDPGYTVPTTSYHTRRPLSRNLLPADYYASRASHAHWSLIFMLVLTQMSVGAFAVEQWLFSADLLAGSDVTARWRLVHLTAAFALGLLGMFGAIFHLGRPLYAFRALLGLRTSWLSREILAFNLFAACTSVYVAAAFLGDRLTWISDSVESTLGMLAVGSGIAAIGCSAMIYIDTRRPFWNGWYTLGRFLLTATLLGLPTALLISLVATALGEGLTVADIMLEYGRDICRATMLVTATKLAFESLVLLHLRDRQRTPLRRVAMVMTGELRSTLARRYSLGVLGGIGLPAVLIGEHALTTGDGFHPLFIVVVASLIVTLLLLAELTERYLFFAASVAPKMPGAPAA